jgi:hypothetical protein
LGSRQIRTDTAGIVEPSFQSCAAPQSTRSTGFEKELGGSLKDEKRISKFERWLSRNGYPHVDRDVRRLQLLRSKVTAHRKGSDHDKFLRKLDVADKSSEEIINHLVAANRMLADLASFFNVELPLLSD